MRQVAVLGAFGGAVGAAVGVITHFVTWQAPQGVFAYAPLAQTITMHHPSWWPILPACVVAGFVVGALLGPPAYMALRILLTRTSSRRPVSTGPTES